MRIHFWFCSRILASLNRNFSKLILFFLIVFQPRYSFSTIEKLLRNWRVSQHIWNGSIHQDCNGMRETCHISGAIFDAPTGIFTSMRRASLRGAGAAPGHHWVPIEGSPETPQTSRTILCGEVSGRLWIGAPLRREAAGARVSPMQKVPVWVMGR